MRQLCRLGRVVLTDDRLDYLAERYIKIKKLLQDVSFESYLLHSILKEKCVALEIGAHVAGTVTAAAD